MSRCTHVFHVEATDTNHGVLTPVLRTMMRHTPCLFPLASRETRSLAQAQARLRVASDVHLVVGGHDVARGLQDVL